MYIDWRRSGEPETRDKALKDESALSSLGRINGAGKFDGLAAGGILNVDLSTLL